MGLVKWILAGLAWAKFGPIGGLLAYFVGGAVEGMLPGSKRNEPKDDYQSNSSYTGGYDGSGGFSGSSHNEGSRRYHNTGTTDDLSAALLVLIAAMMNADNVVRKSELDLVKRFLVSNYGEVRAKELLLHLRELNSKDFPVADICRQIKQNTDYTTRYHMLDFLFSIADADGDISNKELLLLHTISSGLGIATRDYMSIKSRHTASRGTGGNGYGGANYGYDDNGSRAYGEHYQDESPYSVLGISSSATDDEIKKAYRRLAMKYHPDRVENLGDEVRRNAEEQFKKINDAYETIKVSRGLK